MPASRIGKVNGTDATDDSGATASPFQPLYGYFEQKRHTPEPFKVQTQLYSSDIQWDTDLGSLISATSYSAYNPRQDYDITAESLFFPPGLVSPDGPGRRHSELFY